MACTICGATRQWHGSDIARAGTSLMETGCHDGVMMDDDVHAEGWQPNVVYPPCPNNPRACPNCWGSGEAAPKVTTQDDCPTCDGTGWKGGRAEWPTPADPEVTPTARFYERLRQALKRKRGVRLTLDEVEALLAEKDAA